MILLSAGLDRSRIEETVRDGLVVIDTARETARQTRLSLRSGPEAERVLGAAADVGMGRRELLPERFRYPVPGRHDDGRRISRAELPGAARRQATERDRASSRTLEELRAAAAALPEGEYPSYPVMIGGGASLAARDPDRLLIDARGRWHKDPISRIVQTADQMTHLRSTGMGDPHQFASHGERVPGDALRLWENSIAVQGPVVDGGASLAIDDRDRLLVHIQPGDGSAPVTVQVEGAPLVATGFQPESVPGTARKVPNVPRALDELQGHFAGQGDQAGSDLAQRLSRSAQGPGAARDVLETLDREGRLAGLRSSSSQEVRDALQTLNATAHWDHMRETFPDRFIFGDEVGEGRFDPRVSRDWVVAGLGGTGISAAESILQENPDARVTIVGGEPAPVLRNAVQLKELTERHGASGDGRLSIVEGRLTSVEATVRADGEPGVRIRTMRAETDPSGNTVRRPDSVEGGAVAACLGRPLEPPPVLAELMKDERLRGNISGELMFDSQGQYLGYTVTTGSGESRHAFEVVGSSSQALPLGIFTREDQERVARLGETVVPPEAANVPGGFMGTALQAVALEEHRQREGGNPAGGPTSPQRPAAPSFGPRPGDPASFLLASPSPRGGSGRGGGEGPTGPRPNGPGSRNRTDPGIGR
ncbi:hypothetical protein [Nocardiopsis protaetiae]|uniref:hypothetical protein n=1 Tax=Nocardiopsis protaetiae TaxID=3382270 RepID=UPI00387B820E